MNNETPTPTGFKLKPHDTRPKRLGWAPGGYLCTCGECGERFEGDKRASMCADCAYSLPDPVTTPTPTGGQVEMKPCPFCGNPPLTKLLPSERLQATCADCEVNWMSVEDWNTRTTDAENAALREEVNTISAENSRLVRYVGKLRSDALGYSEQHDALTAELARVREEKERLVKLQEAWTAINLPQEVPVPYSELLLEVHSLRAANAGLVEAAEKLLLKLEEHEDEDCQCEACGLRAALDAVKGATK
jgi:hypothetical protein